MGAKYGVKTTDSVGTSCNTFSNNCLEDYCFSSAECVRTAGSLRKQTDFPPVALRRRKIPQSKRRKIEFLALATGTSDCNLKMFEILKCFFFLEEKLESRSRV